MGTPLLSLTGCLGVRTFKMLSLDQQGIYLEMYLLFFILLPSLMFRELNTVANKLEKLIFVHAEIKRTNNTLLLVWE